MRRFAIALLLLPSPALAEVCDKAVGESWRAVDGPVWILNPVGFPLGITLLIVALILVLKAKTTWPGFVVAALTISWAALIVLIDLIPDHFVYQAQVREGCRSTLTDLTEVFILMIFALAYSWLGYRSSKNNAKAV